MKVVRSGGGISSDTGVPPAQSRAANPLITGWYGEFGWMDARSVYIQLYHLRTKSREYHRRRRCSVTWCSFFCHPDDPFFISNLNFNGCSVLDINRAPTISIRINLNSFFCLLKNLHETDKIYGGVVWCQGVGCIYIWTSPELVSEEREGTWTHWWLPDRLG